MLTKKLKPFDLNGTTFSRDRLENFTYNEHCFIKRHIFICGLHRSGTSLLENYIHSTFNVSVLRGDVPENEGQHLQNFYRQAFKFGGAGRFAFAPEAHPKAPNFIKATYARKKIMSCWNYYIVGESDVLVEKSPPQSNKNFFFKKSFPRLHFFSPSA